MPYAIFFSNFNPFQCEINVDATYSAHLYSFTYFDPNNHNAQKRAKIENAEQNQLRMPVSLKCEKNTLVC